MSDVNPKTNKRKLAWVTPDYFVDCDFNVDILKEILKQFDIYWFILLPSFNARFTEADFDELQTLEGLHIDFLYSQHRQRDPRRLQYYYGLYKKIKNLKVDITYINCVPDPYFVPVIWLFNKNKTIFCAHDGGVHSGFDFKLITKISFKLSYLSVRYVCMFSNSQAQLFSKNFPKTKVFVTNLALKSFGNSVYPKPVNEVIFLSFGVINYSKNIELLIEAACNIYDKGYHNFKVSINGSCADWDFYWSFIRYPELFKCDIRIIENTEIADLFSTAHYFVQPYRHVSQSGAMKVAFYYNLPVLATNFPGFSDEIKEGINGYLFPSDNVSELENLMMRVLNEHHEKYAVLTAKMQNYTHDNYSYEVLANKYLNMFNQVISNYGK